MAIAPKSRVRGGWLIALITLIDSMSSCWFGYCQGVFAGVLVSPDFKEQFPQTKNGNVSGIVTSCFLLGAFFGAMLAFVSGDKLGRKKTIIMGHILSTWGATLQFLSWSLPQMIVGRVINGVGVGITSTASPVFLSECARSHMRGRLLIIGASSNVTCFCLANWISYTLYFRAGPWQWRFPLALQLIFPCIIFPLFPFVTESPRWLLLNFRRLLLSCGTQFMQQFSGINALGFYLPTLLHENVGGTIYLVAAFGSLIVIDRVGRRKLMLFGSLGMASCHLISALCLKAGEDHPSQMKTASLLMPASLPEYELTCSKLGSVAVSMFIFYHVFFAPTWGGVPWVYAAEINSLGWRTRGAAAATATNWIMGFVVVQFTKVGIDNLQWRFYLILAVICVSFFPIVLCLYPETARRTLEDMDEIFLHHPSWFVLGNKELTQRERPQVYVEAEARRIVMAQAPAADH
ncbi:Uu.00g104000.m01.CDS01 [Anthostomella pinea]|uniref:Uu.00g104000.m01.CDS01 n=1 Tax=Anthostomella pinea TaxID=933095 RepID=A0AAI8VDI4_9PEZI|nr:Uu.00g104000.m01.CDS01 [Anthostomella pinea]